MAAPPTRKAAVGGSRSEGGGAPVGAAGKRAAACALTCCSLHCVCFPGACLPLFDARLKERRRALKEGHLRQIPPLLILAPDAHTRVCTAPLRIQRRAVKASLLPHEKDPRYRGLGGAAFLLLHAPASAADWAGGGGRVARLLSCPTSRNVRQLARHAHLDLPLRRPPDPLPLLLFFVLGSCSSDEPRWHLCGRAPSWRCCSAR